MTTHITTIGQTGKKQDYFYKTVSTNINISAMCRYITHCHISVDLSNKRDIKRLKDYLDLLENVIIE